MKNIEILDSFSRIKNSDCEVKRAIIDDALILEEYIGKDDGEIKMYCLLDGDTKEIMHFVDVKALENSEYIFDWVKSRYINDKINLSDDEIRAIANKRVEDITDIIMNAGKSRANN